MDQEIFDKVYLGLAGQEFRQARSQHGWLMVLDEAGRRDPAGHLSGAGMELRSWLDAIHVGSTRRGRALGQALTAAHDSSQSPEDMRYRLEMVAREWGLTTPEDPGGDECVTVTVL